MGALREWIRSLVSRRTIRDDAVAGVVLGVESVPDGLAGGLLAGVNPVFGLYGYMIGTVTGALFTSSTFMAVQATGAMAMVVADIPSVHSGDDADRALFTLAILTGVVMLAAGLLKLGSLLRWVSNAVMVGFINAVGINIILGQLDNFSGYTAEGGNRILRALDLLFNLGSAHWPSLLIGAFTITLIIALERTKLGALGMVIAIVVGSAAALAMNDVATLSDITDIPRSLPLPSVPLFGAVPELILPALSLAFIGLVQGAGITTNFQNPDGTYPDASRDFVGQGAANVAAGIFRGMPVGGSMSASSLVKEAGAKSRTALLIAGGVMALTILLLGDLVGYIAMPALAGLLMLVGYRTVKPDDIAAVWKTGSVQAVVMTVTFALTMIIPLQNAVLVGVGISVILVVIKQSNQLVVRRRLIDDRGRMREVAAPEEVPPNEVIVLQPYGSLFFASAPVFEELIPAVTSETRNAVVILRLRGKFVLGSTFMEVLLRYAEALEHADSRLMVVTADARVRDQLEVMGVTDIIGSESLYESDEWVGATVARAHADAVDWVASRNDR